MRAFSMNIQGKVKNFHLPKNQPLIPLLEAIVNSIHAIDERRLSEEGFTNGNISIKIGRDQQLSVLDENSLATIKNFSVTDNGIGFNEANMDSFMTSDTTYKSQLGGKGVGRFSWLVAFGQVSINSTYLDEGQPVKRSFSFSTQTNTINDTLEEIYNYTDNLTEIRLENCIPPYCDNLPKKSSTLAMQILFHCLIYFLSDNCPQIDLIDEDETINLNGLFHEKIKAESNSVDICIEQHNFKLLHVRASDSSINRNELFLCANSRVAVPKKLENYIPNLDNDIFHKTGFYYIGVLTGEYLDSHVDMNRLSFNIPEGGFAENMVSPLSMDKIVSEVILHIELFLKEYLDVKAEEKSAHILDYTTNHAPQYRHLAKFMPEEIKSIKSNLTDDKLDDALYSIKRKFDKQIKSESKKLLKDLHEGIVTTEEYKTRIKTQSEKIIGANSATLAEYVAHRKAIIDLLDFALHQKEDGKFQKESFLHDLIYPMRTTSDEANYSTHNLWLIDEKLAYSSYISSDVPFDNDPKKERTDIMILDSPVAIAEGKNDGNEYDTITLFELKKPMRDDYNPSKNPITQLLDYVDTIKSGKVSDKNGRLIKTGTGTKFYLYAVCDITPTLEKIIRTMGYHQTPDKMGYYGFNDIYNAYVEILPFDKMLNDTQKRNRVLFEKLGL